MPKTKELHQSLAQVEHFYLFCYMKKEFTTEDLAYIAFIARERLYYHYCNSWYQDHYVNKAMDLFRKRVNKIEYASNYELFMSTESLQKKIKDKKLDSDKFWLLLLFLYDYTESCFGEYPVFDSYSVADRLGTMISILNSGQKCKLTLSNQERSIDIDARYMNKELKTLLLNLLHKRNFHYFQFIKKEKNNVLWHKIKFFMDLLEHFLANNQSTSVKKKYARKDWLLISQSLYLVGYLEDEKYLNGYTIERQQILGIDKPDLINEQKIPVPNLGKYFIDNTKHIKDTAIRAKSRYHNYR